MQIESDHLPVMILKMHNMFLSIIELEQVLFTLTLLT